MKFALGLISWKNEKMADKIKKERIWLFCEVFELLNLKKEIVFLLRCTTKYRKNTLNNLLFSLEEGGAHV